MVRALNTDESQRALGALVREVDELRPLPVIATRIVQMAGDSHFSAQELAQVISMDQAITITVLRVANSAFYGLPRRITTLREAVVLLGFREVRSTALAGCLLDAGPLPPFVDYTRFWLNSVVIGQLAEVLAESGGRHLEDAFTAGIIHNAGRLALAQHRPEQLGEAVRTARREGRPIHDVQRERFGFTDADLGAALAETWEFPRPLCEAVQFHASPERVLPEPDALAALVLKARRFARASGTTDGLDEESRITPDIEWASAAIASALQRRGGIDGIRERAGAFLAEIGPP